MYFLGWNPTIALRILFCVTRHGAESISFYVYSIRFWSAASGSGGGGGSWRLGERLKKLIKRIDMERGAAAGEGANSRQLRARRGDCFPALHITPPLEEGREPSGRTDGGGRFRRRRAKSTEKRMRATAPSLAPYPMRRVRPAVAAASRRRRRLWQLSPGERTPVDALRSVGRQDCCMGARVAQCGIVALLCSFQIHRASRPSVI